MNIRNKVLAGISALVIASTGLSGLSARAVSIDDYRFSVRDAGYTFDISKTFTNKYDTKEIQVNYNYLWTGSSMKLTATLENDLDSNFIEFEDNNVFAYGGESVTDEVADLVNDASHTSTGANYSSSTVWDKVYWAGESDNGKLVGDMYSYKYSSSPYFMAGDSTKTYEVSHQKGEVLFKLDLRPVDNGEVVEMFFFDANGDIFDHGKGYDTFSFYNSVASTVKNEAYVESIIEDKIFNTTTGKSYNIEYDVLSDGISGKNYAIAIYNKQDIVYNGDEILYSKGITYAGDLFNIKEYDMSYDLDTNIYSSEVLSDVMLPSTYATYEIKTKKGNVGERNTLKEGLLGVIYLDNIKTMYEDDRDLIGPMYLDPDIYVGNTLVGKNKSNKAEVNHLYLDGFIEWQGNSYGSFGDIDNANLDVLCLKEDSTGKILVKAEVKEDINIRAKNGYLSTNLQDLRHAYLGNIFYDTDKYDIAFEGDNLVESDVYGGATGKMLYAQAELKGDNGYIPAGTVYKFHLVPKNNDGIDSTVFQVFGKTISYGDISREQDDIDVNRDGKVNATDAADTLVFAALQGSGNDTSEYNNTMAYMDVNMDGVVNATDAATLLVICANYGAGYTVDLTDYIGKDLIYYNK